MKYGPFRVWLKNEFYPGLAMSRSIGDVCATSVGVTPEPGIFNILKIEIFEYELTHDCRYMIVASDGVWEFLSNKKVCELTNYYYNNNNPNGACEKIVDESLKFWKKEDEVVDDITAIIVVFNR